jgi:F-type H+-transporting ATPase subunit c
MMLTMLITQALATSPSIFGFVIALLLFYCDGNTLPQAFAYLGAGLAMGIGSLGAAIGIGYVGTKTCEALAKSIKSASAVTKTMFIGVAVTESNSVYALVVALLLLYSK